MSARSITTGSGPRLSYADAVADAESPRWHPDEQLVPAILAGGGHRMSDLSPHDRAWVVAELKDRGLTADQIRSWLGCSLRTVRFIAAEPAVDMARLYLRERENFADELRMNSTEVRRLAAELATTAAERDRYKLQLDRLLDAHLTGEAGPTFRCGHPKSKYNTYTAPKTGKTSCRCCHADAQADYRARTAAAQRDAATAGG